MTSTPLAPGVTPVYGEPVTEEKLQEIVVRIVEQFDPEQIILFGSYAYGDPTPDSDVDLLVIMDSDLPWADRSAAVLQALPKDRLPTDVLAYTPQEIEAQRDRFNPFLYEVLKLGRVLYDRSAAPGAPVRPGGRWWKEGGGGMSVDPVADAMTWVQKAEADFRAAHLLIDAENGLPFDPVCFHAQQCVEKYLKALLVRYQVIFSKTHDLPKLQGLCQQVYPDLDFDEADLSWLTEHGIDTRYPGKIATRADAERALAIMDAARAQLRAEMGLDT